MVKPSLAPPQTLQNAAKDAPRRLQEPPKTPQEPPETPQEPPKTTQDPQRAAQDGQKPSQQPPKTTKHTAKTFQDKKSQIIQEQLEKLGPGWVHPCQTHPSLAIELPRAFDPPGGIGRSGLFGHGMSRPDLTWP